MRLARTWTVLLGLSFACASAPPPRSELPAVSMAGSLRHTDELGPPFMVQQRLHGKHGAAESSLDAVLQLQGGKLTVMGLTPFGTRAFVLEQTGTDVRFEKFVDRELPIEPQRVLYDVHRVFFRGLGPREDGVHRGQDQGDMVEERWQDGQLVERRFQGLEGPSPSLVIVEYEGAPAPLIAPRVRLTNVTFGYVLEIENLEQRLLDAPAAGTSTSATSQ